MRNRIGCTIQGFVTAWSDGVPGLVGEAVDVVIGVAEGELRVLDATHPCI